MTVLATRTAGRAAAAAGARWPALAVVAVVATALASVGAACGGSRLAAFGVPAVSGDGRALETESLESLAGRGDPDAYVALAAVRFARGELRAARAHAERALGLDPEHVGATALIARVEARAGGAGVAATLYRRAVAISPGARVALAPEWSEALLALAEDHVARGEPARALAALDELERELPERAERARARRAGVLLDAVALWQDIDVVAPIAAALERARDAGADPGEVAFAEARAAHARARNEAIGAGADPGADPGQGPLAGWASRVDQASRWRRVAVLHGQRAELAEAEHAWREVAAHDPRDPEPLERAAALAVRRGAFDVAVATWTEAGARLAQRDGGQAAAAALVAAARQVGWRDAVNALEEAALAHAPDAWEVVDEVAARRAARGDADGAVAALVAWSGAQRGVAEVVRAAARALDLGLPAGALELLATVEGEASTVEALVVTGRAAGMIWRARADRPDGEDPLGGAGRETFVRSLERAEAVASGRPTAEAVAGLAAVGAAWLELGEVAQARRVADAIKRLAPDELAGPLLAASAGDLRRRGAAPRGADLEAFAAARGEDPEAALAVGRWLAEREQRERGARWLELAATSERPETVEAAREALFVLFAAARPEEARRHLRAWLDAAPARRPAILGALAAAPTRHAGLRRDILDGLARVRPDDPDVFSELGAVALAEGDDVGAERAFARHVALSEDTHDALARVLGALSAARRDDLAGPFAARLPVGRLSQQHALAAADHHAARGDEAAARSCYLGFLERVPASSTPGLQAFADRMRDTGRYELAVAAFGRILERGPASPQALRGLAQTHLRRGDVKEAERLLGAYSEGTPRTQRQRLEEVARVLAGEGRLRAAAEVYERRLTLDLAPNIEVFSHLVDLRRRLGDREGLARAGAALVERSTRVGAQRFFEIAHARLRAAGSIEAAERILAAGLERSGRDRRLQLADLQAAIAGREPARAYAAAERIARGQAGSPQGWAAVAGQLLGGGFHAEAERLLDEAIARYPAEAGLFSARAASRLAQGRPDEAQRDLHEGLARALSPSEVLEVAEGLYRPAHQLERLRELQARAAGLAPARADHAVAFARSLIQAGQVDEGRQVLASHLASNSRAELAVARALHAEGLLEPALEHYLRALDQAQPREAADAFGQIATILAARGDAARLDEAVRLYLAAGLGRPPAYEQVARAHLAVGQPVEALAWMRRFAAERAVDRVDALDLARLLDALGDEVGALEATVRLLELRSTEQGPGQAAALLEVARGEVLSLLDAGRADAARHLAERLARSGAFGGSWTSLLEARVAAAAGAPIAIAAQRAPGGRAGEQGVAAPLAVEVADALVARARPEVAATLLERTDGGRGGDSLAAARLVASARAGDLARADVLAAELGATHNRALAASAFIDAGYPERARDQLLLASRGTSGAGLARADLAALDAALPWLVRAERGAGDDRAAASPRALGGGEDAVEQGTARLLVALARGDDRAALAAAEATLELAPDNQDLLAAARLSAARLGDPAALERVRALDVRAHGSPMKAFAAARDAALEAGDPALALAAVEAWIAQHLGDGGLRLEAVELALEAGDVSRAASHGRAYLETVGGGAPARLDLAERYAGRLRLDLARRELEAIDGRARQERGAAGVGDGPEAEETARGPLAGPLAARRALIGARVALLAGDSAEAEAWCGEHVASSDDEVLARTACAEEVERLGGPPGLALALLEPLSLAASGSTLRLTASAAWRAGDAETARGAARALASRFVTEPSVALLEAAVRAGDAVGAGELAGWFARARVPLLDVVEAATRGLEARLAAAGRGAGGEREPSLVAFVADLAERAGALAAPGEPAVARAWAQLALARGDEAGARLALEEALARRPGSVELTRELAWFVAERAGDLAGARRLADGLVARGRLAGTPGARARGGQGRDAIAAGRDRYEAEAAALRGWILHREGRSEEGLVALAAALGRAGGSPEVVGRVLARRAEVLEAVGRTDAAAAAWRACAWRLGAGLEGRACRARALGGVDPR